MANGSFGLSGLPSAPTTVAVDSAIKTPLTAATVPISTSTGFQANDLVYFKNGNFGPVPDNATASATFPVATQVSTYNGPIVSTGTGLNKTLTSMNTGISAQVNSLGLSSTGLAIGRLKFSDVLANGNIIVVCGARANDNSAPIFATVYSESGDVVVGPTFMGAYLGNNNWNVGVCALPNGNAVIYWVDSYSTGKWYFKTVDSTLSTVLANTEVQTGTQGNANSTCHASVGARSDSSIVIAWTTTANSNVSYKVLDTTTGAAVYATGTVGTRPSPTYHVSVAVRQDDGWVVGWLAITSQNLSLRHYNSTNTSISNVNTGLACPDYQWGNVITKSNGTNFVAFARSGAAYYLTYNGSSSWGSASTFTATNSISGVNTANVAATSGGYLLTISTSDSPTDADYTYIPLSYLYDNSNVLQSSTSYNRASGSSMLAAATQLSVVKTANYFNLFSMNMWNSSPDWDYTNGPRQITWARLNPTSATNVPWSSTTGSLGNTTAQAVTGYARTNSTPTAAAFFAATTGLVGYTQTQSTTQATLVVGQTVVESIACNAMDSCTLTNGNVVIIYKTGTYVVKCAVYTNQGVAVNSFTVASTGVSTAGTTVRSVSIAPLTNGNFVVTWYASSGTYQINWRIYNGTTFATIASGVNNYANTGHSSNQYAMTSGFDGDRWVLAYQTTSNFPAYEVRSSTGTLLAASNTSFGSTTTNIGVVAGAGSIYLTYNVSAYGNYVVDEIVETTTNNFTNNGWQNTYGSSSYAVQGAKPQLNLGGNCVFMVPTGSGSYQILAGSYNYWNGATLTTSQVGSSINMGVTSNGDIILGGGQTNGPAGTLRYYVLQNSTYSNPTNIDIPSFSFANGAGEPMVNWTPLFNNRMMLTCLNASFYPTFTIINVKGSTGSTLLTAGVTVSNADLTLSPTNGFYLTGVSTGSASAGGTANVQINGSISLNSSYPSGTTYQAFDFSNPLLYGVKGTIVGRNVTMQGNV